jgi:hypothetical protein
MIEMTMREKNQISFWQLSPVDRIPQIRIDVYVQRTERETYCTVPKIGKTH